MKLQAIQVLMYILILANCPLEVMYAFVTMLIL